MKKLLFAALSTALLAGCAPTPKQINIPYQFDSNQAKKQLEPGSERLEGNAFLRQVGGGIVNCAGYNVDLYPSSPYTKARIEGMYPLNQWLGNRFISADTFNPDYPDFKNIKRSTTCDSEGNFVFDSLKTGEYIVVTEVRWSVPSQFGMQQQGGYILKPITVTKGQKNKLVISQ